MEVANWLFNSTNRLALSVQTHCCYWPFVY